MKVSVVIPVFQSEAWGDEAVASCLRQPEVAEVLLVEDGSTDGSYVRCEALARSDDRVRLLTHPGRRNRGVAATRNLGVQQSTAPFVAFLDADDRFRDGRFARAARQFEAEPEVDGVYDPVERFFESAEAEQRYVARGRRLRYEVDPSATPETLFGVLARGERGMIVTPGIVVRRPLLERAGPFPEDMPAGEDTVMWHKLAALGRLVSGGSLEAVADARVHGDNLSESLWDRYPQLWRRVWEHLLGWSATERLRPDDVRLVERQVVRMALRADPGDPGSVRGSAAWLGLGLRVPRLLRSRAYWREAPLRRRWRSHRREAP